MDQIIKDQVFMGSGNMSYIGVGYLHSRLSEAFVLLNGMQQPPRPDCPGDSFKEHEKDVRDGEHELNRIVQEIALGLTGKKYVPVKKESSK